MITYSHVWSALSFLGSAVFLSPSCSLSLSDSVLTFSRDILICMFCNTVYLSVPACLNLQAFGWKLGLHTEEQDKVFLGSVVHRLHASVIEERVCCISLVYILTITCMNDGSFDDVSGCHLHNQHEASLQALCLHLSVELSLCTALNQMTHKKSQS